MKLPLLNSNLTSIVPNLFCNFNLLEILPQCSPSDYLFYVESSKEFQVIEDETPQESDVVFKLQDGRVLAFETEVPHDIPSYFPREQIQVHLNRNDSGEYTLILKACDEKST